MNSSNFDNQDPANILDGYDRAEVLVLSKRMFRDG